MVTAYRIPTEIQVNGETKNLDIQEFKAIVAEIPAEIEINPVQDVNGAWFISAVEWDLPAWQPIKEQFPEFAAAFELADFEAPAPMV